MPLRPLLASAAVLVLAVGAVTAGVAAAPPKKPSFASASTATVTPGVQTVTTGGGGQCTANFVFVDSRGTVYLGQSAHCASLGEATDTDGCIARSLPLGTAVQVDGASKPGVLAYSSWLAMQNAGEKNASACDYNDFALVRLDPSDVRRTNPSVPYFGGPIGLDTDGTHSGERVVSYGNSSLRFGLEDTSPKRGVALGTFDPWSHQIYTATPGIPGDSGSAVLDGAGRALGTLSTVAIAPYPASNGVSDLARQIAYARGHGVPGLTLVPGTEKFAGIF